jgi:hypothetical protein
MGIGETELARLLAGIAEALGENVLPKVDDHYARLQVRAARSLLGTIAGHVVWTPDAAEHVARTAVAEAGVPVAGGGPGLAGARAELGAVADAVYGLPEGSERDRTLAAVWQAVRHDQETARARRDTRRDTRRGTPRGAA